MKKEGRNYQGQQLDGVDGVKVRGEFDFVHRLPFLGSLGESTNDQVRRY